MSTKRWTVLIIGVVGSIPLGLIWSAIWGFNLEQTIACIILMMTTNAAIEILDIPLPWRK